ncbi:MAG: hypothetical protein ACXAEX_20730 [Promethearchaeota archaeon]|jgi:uncharacterized membrane protein
MMFGYWGMGWGMWFWLIMLFGCGWFFWGWWRPRPRRHRRYKRYEDPFEIARTRYARSEITLEEYEAIRKTLESTK